jgi:hypothetical protein
MMHSLAKELVPSRSIVDNSSDAVFLEHVPLKVAQGDDVFG